MLTCQKVCKNSKKGISTGPNPTKTKVRQWAIFSFSNLRQPWENREME